jgi:hypothetical protein
MTPLTFDEHLAATKRALAAWNEAEAAVADARIAMARDVQVMIDPRKKPHPSWIGALNGEAS